MRVLVTGDREWTDTNLVTAILTGLWSEDSTGHLTVEMHRFILIEGGAPGADAAAAWWADHSPMHSHNERPDDPFFAHEQYQAHWRHAVDCPQDCHEMTGRAAGAIRNRKMLATGLDLVIAFHDDLWGRSKGTKDMVTIAKKAGVEVWTIAHH